MWTVSQISWYHSDIINLDTIRRHKLTLWESESVLREKKNFWKRSFSRSVKTHKCYNCDITEHLVRDDKKSHHKRKELAAINKKVVHNQFSWMTCYNNMC